ncbi:MAG: hypothetical protein PHR35_17015, partial [Kiritimatiellae bacterium]|nr:hypothetical protein [Kiritimatiellia bacterium]
MPFPLFFYIIRLMVPHHRSKSRGDKTDIPSGCGPRSVALLLSTRCNNRCVMCIKEDALDGIDVSTDILVRGILAHRSRGCT